MPPGLIISTTGPTTLVAGTSDARHVQEVPHCIEHEWMVTECMGRNKFVEVQRKNCFWVYGYLRICRLSISYALHFCDIEIIISVLFHLQNQQQIMILFPATCSHACLAVFQLAVWIQCLQPFVVMF